MLSEGFSIRNLRAILEALLDVDYLVIGSEYNVFNCRLKLARQPEPNWRQNPQHLIAIPITYW